MNYSILVADDEARIREGFIARLRYLGMEPSNVYEASNGEEALEHLSTASPDIVVTDIRMPGMEGLELIRRAKERLPGTEFVILSGYAEFTFAEQAIKLGVHAYLVKPLSNNELARVMKEIFQKLEENRRIAAVLEWVETKDQADQEWVLEKQISDLLAGDGKEISDGSLASFLRHGGWYAAAVARIDKKEAGRNGIESDLKAVRHCFQEQAKDCRGFLAGDPLDRAQCYLVFRGASPEGVSHSAEELLNRMARRLRGENGIILTTGISSPARTLSAKEARQARKALCQRIISGGGRAYLYSRLPRLDGTSFPEQEFSSLQRDLERRDLGGAEDRLKIMFSRAEEHNLPVAYLRLVWIRVTNLLLDVLGLPQRAEPDCFELDYDDMKKFSTVADMREALFSLIAEAAGTGKADELDSLAKIRMAERYIEERYDRELSVNSMAEMYGLSPNYFSALFHRETGVTVVNHIKNTRIRRAGELLRDTDDSAVEIAGRVGYADSQYFFRVFKKETGLSPLRYRKMIRESPQLDENKQVPK